MAIKHEAELYAPLKAFFEMRGYLIKGEVRDCDLVGVREDGQELMIAEMKKTFNLALLLQGLERLKMSPHVYLAVEKSRAKKGAVNQRWNEISSLCQRLGLGLVTVTFYKTKPPFVEVLCEPEAYQPPSRGSSRKRERLLLEFRERSGDYNTGGVSRAKLVTAYREKALRVAAALAGISRDMPGAPGKASSAEADLAALDRTLEAPPPLGTAPAKIRDLSGVGNAAAILQRNYYGWFERIGRGRYVLTPEGRRALETYAAVLETHSSRGETAP
ncbi:DUF2161 family putative PD-(D/E)XK-type phosphodiesterase [Paenibacillus lemnae]|uniref:Uncharacterized protein n=1 Tax=Paenibacillus lemnae TaxID=1330551 RepID=A0A848M723_PAELE|nr:DUF2161 family putative PD-(D/E)XK-type phosphodiesterase [Paenibacillus lemnae]NMO96011.1 hypothetical protein [Paenibacillus lemnae]